MGGVRRLLRVRLRVRSIEGEAVDLHQCLSPDGWRERALRRDVSTGAIRQHRDARAGRCPDPVWHCANRSVTDLLRSGQWFGEQPELRIAHRPAVDLDDISAMIGLHQVPVRTEVCLLYTSDAADERSS